MVAFSSVNAPTNQIQARGQAQRLAPGSGSSGAAPGSAGSAGSAGSPRASARVPAAGREIPAWSTWLIGPVLLASALGGLALLRSDPSALFPIVGLASLLVLVLWILTSVLWPARADRNCPECGQDALKRLNPSTTMGLTCDSCGFRDETLSSWYLAEEEGPLEGIVLAQRRRSSNGARLTELDSQARAGYESPRENPSGESPENTSAGRQRSRPPIPS